MARAELEVLGSRVRAASRRLAGSSPAAVSDALRWAAEGLVADQAALLAANEADVARAEAATLGATALDRLRLDERRIAAMASALEDVAAMETPLGEIVERRVLANGLDVARVRVPLGVVGIIYENRPNVTTDAAALCLRAGNAAFLRGSSSAFASNRAIVSVLRSSLAKAALPEDAVALVEDTSHEAGIAFMRLRGIVDCLVPRGGPALIAALLEHATVPYVLDGAGNCHVYVDRSADLAMAETIVRNAKVQRPGVCNAAESLLVHAETAGEALPRLRAALPEVELRGDERVRRILPDLRPATDEDFATEYLDLVMSVAVVDDLGAAIDHIARFGSGHSETIVTADPEAAERFVREVDAAAVLVNTSPRFVDGSELGLGAEVGISTQKLHARGPMGVRELTCVKWVIRGDGQVRA
jgi:glutamate-5-semialdehyde dehydrogenase